jgi:inhibitor of cysteine peptidase
MRKLTGLLVVMTLISLIPALPAVAAGGTGPFTDVSADYVNATAIQYLKTTGVISGYPDGTYMPTNEINRAEFTKIVVGALYTDLKGKNCFPDVKEEWYAPYVCKAKDEKIIEGYPDGNFKPEEKIKFSEAAKIIANTMGGGVAPAALASSSGQWYKPYVTTLEAKKDIPLSVEFFDENVTRDEMAEMIYRLKSDVTNKATRTYAEIEGDGLVMVNSCADLKERFVEQNQYSMYRGEGLGGGGDLGVVQEALPAPTNAVTGAPVSADSTKAAGSYTGGGSTDFSTTNVQVEGVDEADVVKNDGRYIYLIRGNSLRIVDAYPADNLKEIVSFVLGGDNESFYPIEMYVDGDMLTVIGSVSRYTTLSEPAALDSKISSDVTYPYFGYNRTKVYVVNIADRSKPTIARSVEYDGSYNTSRKVGDTLYMIMNQYIYYPYYSPLDASAKAEPADAIVPKMLDTAVGTEKAVAPCGDIYILPKAQNFNYLIASAVPLKDLTKEVKNSVVVGDTGNIYSSKANLYVAGTDWGGGYYRQYSDYGTTVYRFALADGSIAYKNSGKVPGTVLNQFAMDENNGYFRIATTKDEWTPGSAMSTGVYVMNSAMDTVGKVEKIAPGEKMYSARFMGKTAYLVTFKRVDPFFVLDLSDAKNPVIKGKLKIPGYSTYLQPYDDNHVLGFGNDVDPTKITEDSDWLPYDATLGMKISMFDVTDINNPKEMFKEVIGDRGTSSEVLYNHKALLFDKEKGLMAFPVTVYEIPKTDICSTEKYSTCPSTCQKICVPSSCTTSGGIKVCTADCDGADSCKSYDTTYGKPVFDGAYVYNVNLTKGFELKGKISHYNEADTTNLTTNGYTDYNKTIQRALYIGEYLYTISPTAIKANLLSDLSEKKMIGELWNLYYGAAG